MDTSSDEEGEGEEGDGMDEDGEEAPRGVPLAPEPREPRAPVVDEDGFTMVQGKGRRGGRR